MKAPNFNCFLAIQRQNSQAPLVCSAVPFSPRNLNRVCVFTGRASTMSEEEAQPIDNQPPPKKKTRRRSRIVQLASFVVLVAVLVLVWHFLGPTPNQAAHRQHGEVVPV